LVDSSLRYFQGDNKESTELDTGGRGIQQPLGGDPGAGEEEDLDYM